MRFASLLALFVGCGSVVGCGSKDETVAPADTGVATGDALPDTKPNPDVGSPIDISGALVITARVVTIDDKGDKVPQADFPARIENVAGGWIDAKTGADGVVTFKVDAAKGPFDLTVAKATYGVISVLSLTAPAGDIITYALEDSASPSTTVAGTITGKQDAANRVMVDAWAFSTFVGTTANYSSKATNDPDLPLVVAAIEVDSTDKILNGAITAPQTRTSSAMTANIVFPSPAAVATTKTLTVKFPTSGVLAGALTSISEVTSDKKIGNALVVKSNKFAQMFVGVARVGTPASNTSTITLQSFAGDMAPDTVLAAWSGGDLYARANIRDLMDGSTTTFGDVAALDLEGSALSDLTFATDGTGYEYSELELIDNEGSGVVWRCFQNGAKVASRKLPHLPAQTKLADVAPGFSPRAVIVLLHRTGASATPWGDNASYDLVVSNATPDAIDSSGR
jgi:hypothetical protein